MSDSPELDPVADDAPTNGTRPDLFNGAPLVPGNPKNSGGKRGRSGRLPRAWKEFARETLMDPEVQAVIRKRALKGHPAILKLLTDHGQGLPVQPLAIDADPGVLDRLLARLAPQSPPDAPDAPVAGQVRRDVLRDT